MQQGIVHAIIAKLKNTGNDDKDNNGEGTGKDKGKGKGKRHTKSPSAGAASPRNTGEARKVELDLSKFW